MIVHLPVWLRNLRSRPSTRRRRLRHGVLVEFLESRTMLAGNVAAVVEDGNLILTGDEADNSVEVTIVDGDLVVRGLDDTMVNGGDQPFVAMTGTTTLDGDLRSSLSGGADTLRVTGPLTVTGRTRIDDAQGATQIGITDTSLDGAVHINTGHDADAISFVGSTLGDNLSVNLGGGANQLSIFESTIVGDVSLSAGGPSRWFSWTREWRDRRHGMRMHREHGMHGRDALPEVRDSLRNDGQRHRMDFRAARHRMSDGENDIVIEGSTLGSLSLRTGRASDDVVIQDSTVDGNLQALTGGGDDFVMFDGSTVAGHASTGLGSGDDKLVTQNANTFEGNFYADGMRGRHDARQTSDETVFNEQSRFRRFEETTVSEMMIDMRGTDTLAAAATLRQDLNGLPDDNGSGAPMLTLDTSTNDDTIESNDTLVTTLDTFNISGQTAAGATIDVAAGTGGVIDLGTTTADMDGNFSIDVDLLEGGTTIRVTATTAGGSTTEQFNLHRAVGSVVRFISSEGTFDVEMLNEDAPITVGNFESYFDRYINSFIHRAGDGTGGVPSVIQGGGFTFDGGDIEPISSDPSIVNEFDPTNSNLAGTLSTALSGDGFGGTDFDSADSQWFFNLVDNVFLDAARHTVFGRIIGTGLDVARAIQSLPRFDITGSVESPPIDGFDRTNALTDVPLDGYSELSEALPGTVSIAANSIIVNGTGTNFLSTLEPGEIVRIGGVNRAVLEVNSDTMLTLTSSPTTAVTGATVFVNPVPEIDELVLFMAIFELLPAP